MEIEKLKEFLINSFGTPTDYTYLVVHTLKNGYADPYNNGTVLFKLSNHTTPSEQDDRIIFTVKYCASHSMKLIIFQDVVVAENKY